MVRRRQGCRRWGRLLTVAVVAVIAWRILARRRGAEPLGEPVWKPLAGQPDEARSPARSAGSAQTSTAGTAQTSSAGSSQTGPAPAPSETRRWVDPLPGGACPASHPVKGNADSGIYHVPGGMFYDRTVAERCYATPDDAEADGFRRAKR